MSTHCIYTTQSRTRSQGAMGPKSSAGGALCVSLDVCDDARRGAPASLDFADASVLPVSQAAGSRRRTHDNDTNAAGEWVKVAPPKGTPGQVDQGAPSSGGAGHDWAKAPASAYAWEPLPR